MKTVMRFLLSVTLFVAVATGCADLTKITMKDVPRIEPDQLVSYMKDPDVAIIDIRLARSWQASSRKIEGACREDGGDFSNWKIKYAKDKKIVLYCA